MYMWYILVCICGISIKHMQCSDNRDVCRYVYGVQGYIYTYETRGSGSMPPQGKFEFLGEIMLHLRPFYTTQGQFSHSSRAFSIVIQ